MSQLKSVLERIYADFQDKIKPMTKSEFIKKYKTNPKEETVPGPKKPRILPIFFTILRNAKKLSLKPESKESGDCEDTGRDVAQSNSETERAVP